MSALTREGKRSIILAVLQIICALACVISGALAMAKLSKQDSWLTAGIWAVYFILPASLSLVSAFTGGEHLPVLALTTNIMGTVVAAGGLSAAAILWDLFTSICSSTWPYYDIPPSTCMCHSSMTDNEGFHFYASCDDVTGTIKSAVISCTILYALLAIITLTTCIYGCMDACGTSQARGPMSFGGMQRQTVAYVGQNSKSSGSNPPSYNKMSSSSGGNMV